MRVVEGARVQRDDGVELGSARLYVRERRYEHVLGNGWIDLTKVRSVRLTFSGTFRYVAAP